MRVIYKPSSISEKSAFVIAITSAFRHRLAAFLVSFYASISFAAKPITIPEGVSLAQALMQYCLRRNDYALIACVSTPKQTAITCVFIATFGDCALANVLYWCFICVWSLICFLYLSIK
ncbi:hypothetical protein Tcan_00889, partial [Toxocara canis]